MEMIIKEIEAKNVITKSNLPVCDFSVNPYTGCTHACKYCYASFMKRFSNHPEPWGEFIDVLDTEVKGYAAEIGLDYVTNDDSMSRPFDAPPVIVNYFYHSEIKKSARKGAMRPVDACFATTGTKRKSDNNA